MIWPLGAGGFRSTRATTTPAISRTTPPPAATAHQGKPVGAALSSSSPAPVSSPVCGPGSGPPPNATADQNAQYAKAAEDVFRSIPESDLTFQLMFPPSNPFAAAQGV